MAPYIAWVPEYEAPTFLSRLMEYFVAHKGIESGGGPEIHVLRAWRNGIWSLCKIDSLEWIDLGLLRIKGACKSYDDEIVKVVIEYKPSDMSIEAFQVIPT